MDYDWTGNRRRRRMAVISAMAILAVMCRSPSSRTPPGFDRNERDTLLVVAEARRTEHDGRE